MASIHIASCRLTGRLQLFSLACLFCLAVGARGQTMPQDVRSLLAEKFGFTDKQFKEAEAGQPVAKIVPSGRADDLQLIGIVRMDVGSEKFIAAYKDIAHFEIGKEVLQTGKFSNPPVESDLAGLHFPDIDEKEMRACHPGKCAYKLPAATMEELQKHINWSDPAAKAQLDEGLRKAWIEYLNRYREQGDAALAVYYDTPQPFSVAQGLKEIISGLGDAHTKIPDLLRYLDKYPAARPADTEDFFYWQEAAFGLKPIVRTSQVIIQKVPGAGDPTYYIASKMLFASHYFRAALELKWVAPTHTESGQPAVYFLSYQRSYVDGMTGVGGALLRRVVPGRSRASLVENLRLAKEQLERNTNQAALR